MLAYYPAITDVFSLVGRLARPIPIQERHQMNLSPERAQELAKAGSDAMDAMDGLNRAFDGKQGEIKERVGELKILVAASTNAGILNKNRKK